MSKREKERKKNVRIFMYVHNYIEVYFVLFLDFFFFILTTYSDLNRDVYYPCVMMRDTVALFGKQREKEKKERNIYSLTSVKC